MTNPEEHLDIAALQDLKDIMESEYETLVHTFISDTRSKLDELDNVIGLNDSENLRKVAHSLKGSSSNVCAFRLSEYARQLEMIAKEGQLQGAKTLLSELETEFCAVSEILSESL